MELTIVILNWNAATDTISCVSAISAWEVLRPIIIVVDNASSDSSVEIISGECPNVHLIRNMENQGFSGGTNRGIEAALALSDAPILLLNNDALLGEADLTRLLTTLLGSEDIGLVGPLLFDTDDETRLLSAGGKNPIKHHHTRILELAPGDAVRFVEYVSGTAVLIRPEVFHNVGFLDEDYFFSTELADLCMRARLHGYKSAIDNRARAYHTVSRSSNLRNTLYVYYIVRNRFIYIRNSPYRLKLLYYGFWTGYSIALSVKLLLSGKADPARAVRLGLIDGLRRRFGGQNERVLSAIPGLTETISS